MFSKCSVRLKLMFVALLGLFVLPLAVAPAQYNPVPKATDWTPTGRHYYPSTGKWVYDPAPPLLEVGAPLNIVQPVPPKFLRGAKRSPAHKMMAVPRFTPAFAAPDKFAVVPPKTSMWGNATYGCCVSSQTACSIAAWSTRCLGPDKEVLPTEAEVIAFARKHGWLNGAYLTEVMDAMQKTGMSVGGVTYREGSYYSVDYSKPAELQAALYVGPVNIAIDADALPAGAGNKSGWYALGKGNFPNTDHCVALLGYGPAAYCYQTMGVPLPATVPADTFGYILFTWNTVGFVTQDWIDSTTAEAYVRNPTTVGMLPPAPPGPPDPPAPPVPGAGFTGTIARTQAYKDGVAVGPEIVVVTGTTSQTDLKSQLEKAGVNPLIILDVLKLVADIQAKADKSVIFADLLKILMDFAG